MKGDRGSWKKETGVAIYKHLSGFTGNLWQAEAEEEIKEKV